MKTKQLTKNWKEIELEELLDYEQPTKYIVKSTNYDDSYQTPVLTAGKSFLLGYTNETEGIFDNPPVIIFDDFTTATKYVDFKFKVKSSAMKILKPKNEKISPRFIFYMMKGIRINSSTHKRYYLSVYQQIKIPIPFKDGEPDLEEQERIVKILEDAQRLKEKGENVDNFLDEYLKSVFSEMFLVKGYPEEKLENLCVIRRGASPRPIKKYLGGDVPWIKIGDGTRGGDIYMYNTREKITEEGAKKSVMLKSGSFIFANCGVSLGFARIIKFDGCIHDGWLSFANLDKSKLDGIYLLKFINSLTDHLRKTAPDGTQPNLNTGIMKRLKVPLPPLSEQRKFSKIVDQINGMKEYIKKINLNSGELFNSLTDKAFGGKL